MIHPSKSHNPLTDTVPSPTRRPWENSPTHRRMIRNLQRQELVDRVRLLLLRQKRAYIRRLKLLQQQSQERQMKNSELLENNQLLRLTMDLPGVRPSDVQVEIDTTSRILSISAKRSFMSLDGVTCRRTQVLCQQYRVHSNVSLHFKATLQHGVLTITAPKSPPSSQSKEINQEIEIDVSTCRSSSERMGHETVLVVPISYL
jgi:HSP20 family molecular chaperone IbpA